MSDSPEFQEFLDGLHALKQAGIDPPTPTQEFVARARALQAELDAMGVGRPVPPAPTEEDSEAHWAGGLITPVFLWTFTAIGTRTIEAARVHIRVRARSLREAQERIKTYLGYEALTLVEVQELQS